MYIFLSLPTSHLAHTSFHSPEVNFKTQDDETNSNHEGANLEGDTVIADASKPVNSTPIADKNNSPDIDWHGLNRCMQAYEIAEFCGITEMKKQAVERFRLLAPAAAKYIFFPGGFAGDVCKTSSPTDRGLRDIICSLLKSHLNDMFDDIPEEDLEQFKETMKLLNDQGDMSTALPRETVKDKKKSRWKTLSRGKS